jgi:Domain of unknown function (DUF4394)
MVANARNGLSRLTMTVLAAALGLLAVLPALFSPGPASASPDTIYAVTSSNLLRFDSSTPGTVTTVGALTGLQGGDNIFAIDFRPATGQLYGIGTSGQLYTINTTTAAATPVGAPFALSDPSGASIDFHPTVDRIRVVSSAADENFRVNPDTGAVAGIDTGLAYDAGDPNAGANPNVLAIGYTNNFTGTATTTLYGIDTSLDILVRQGGVDGVPSPNGGQLFTIGSLGVDSATAGTAGLDINAGNTAFALLEVSLTSQLYTIDLSTGAATLVGNIGAAQAITDIAVQVVPATPSPSPSPSAAPSTAATATPTIVPTQIPAVLPPTGGERGDGSPLVVVALIAMAIIVSTGWAFAYGRRRIR